jgi:hypothetical protein
MKVTTVRYKIAPDRVQENIRFVRAIFSQLHETSPSGLRYACMTAGDGSFMHIVCIDDDASDEALTSLRSFQDFRAGFQDRALEPSTFTEYEVVGNFGLF